MIHAIVAPLKTAIAGMTLFNPDTTDTRLAGVVMPVTRQEKDGKRLTFPVSCDVDGAACYEQGRYFDLLPNDRYRAVIYFEQSTDVRLIGYKDERDKVYAFGCEVRLVGWINAKKLGSTDCAITDRIVLAVINALTAEKGETSRQSGRFELVDANYDGAVVDATVVRQVRRDPAIFSRYTFNKGTELLYPWDYFALDIACEFYVGKSCFNEVEAGTEIVC